MILSKHLHELAAFKTPGAAVLSIYLDVDGGRLPQYALRAALKTAPREQLAGLEADVEALESAVEEHRCLSERGLALFSSQRFGLTRLCPLPEPVRALVAVDSKPCLKRLLNIADQRLRYGAAVLGRDGARFFEYFMGRARELPEQTIRPGDIAGGRPSLLRSVAARLESLKRTLGLQRIIVAADEKMEKGLIDQLHRTVLDDLILDPALAGDAACDDVRERVSCNEAQARRLRELVLAHRLVDEAGQNAAVGLRRAMEAVEQGRVKTLLVRDGFAKIGRRCRSCSRLWLNDLKCLCGGSTDTIFNLADELGDRALEQGAEVYRLMSQTPLDNLGSIAVELRSHGTGRQAPAREMVKR